MEFTSVVNPPVTVMDKCGGPIRVNRAGYRSAKDQIESMLMAGQNLVKNREEAYNTVKELNDESFSNYIETPEAELLAINPLLATAVKRRKEAFAASQESLKKRLENESVKKEPQAPITPKE